MIEEFAKFIARSPNQLENEKKKSLDDFNMLEGRLWALHRTLTCRRTLIYKIRTTTILNCVPLLASGENGRISIEIVVVPFFAPKAMMAGYLLDVA